MSGLLPWELFSLGLVCGVLIQTLAFALYRLWVWFCQFTNDDADLDYLIDHGLMLTHSKHGWSVVRNTYPHLPIDPSCVEHPTAESAINQAIKVQTEKWKHS